MILWCFISASISAIVYLFPYQRVNIFLNIIFRYVWLFFTNFCAKTSGGEIKMCDVATHQCEQTYVFYSVWVTDL